MKVLKQNCNRCAIGIGTAGGGGGGAFGEGSVVVTGETAICAPGAVVGAFGSGTGIISS